MGQNKIIFSNILAFFLVSLLFLTGGLENLENLLIDLSHRLNSRPEYSENSPITIVAIDETSMEEFPRWPWPRSILAQGVEKIFASGARSIGIDILFLDEREGDEELAGAMEKGSTYLPMSLNLGLLRRIRQETPLVRDINFPVSLLAEKAAGIGHVNYLADRDGIIRRFPFVDDHKAWFQLIAEELVENESWEELSFQNTYIRFSGPGNPFPTVSFKDLFSEDFDGTLLENRIVLIGSTDPTLGDLIMTPFANHGFIPGVVLGAHAIQTLSEGQEIIRLNIWIVLSIFAFLYLFNWFFFNRSNFRTNLIFSLAQLTIIIVFGHLLFSSGYLLDRVPLLLGVTLQSTIQLYDQIIRGETRQKKLKNLFQRYLPPEIVERITTNPEMVNLEGESKEVVALFVDLRGFTIWSSGRTSQETVKTLNIFFRIVTDAAMEHGGTLDKFLGDGALIIFGAPLPLENSLEQALEAVAEIQKKLIEIDFPLPLGAGLEIGEVIAGNIGSEKRLEYTVIGSPVNTASHLEERARPGELILGPAAARKYAGRKENQLAIKIKELGK